jgi:outer membrane protein assembly factor BamB
MIRQCRAGSVYALILSLLLTISFRARAAEPANEWRQWRGPHFNGSSDAKNLPERFDDKTNVKWTTALPGPSSATPVVCGDRVFVSVLDKSSKKLLAVCVSRKDGHVMWQKEVGEGFIKNERNNMASPSPVCDEKNVWFYYGTGDLISFDHDGNQKWSRSIAKDFGAFNYQWIYGASPLLYDGRLYVQVYHRDHPIRAEADAKTSAPSYLLAVDPQTGKDLWRHERPNEALEESKESYGTPVPFELNGKKLLLSIGGDIVTANDATSGEEIWRCGGWNLPPKRGDWRIVSSPVVAGGLVIACPPKGGAIFAVRPDGTGDVTSSHVAWKNREISSDVCVPLFYKNKLFVLNGDGPKTLYRVDPATGKVETSVKLGGNDVFRASPTAADGKIYCMNEAAEVWVVSTAADKLEIVNKADLGGGASTASRSTIALAEGEIFVRTGEKLFCIGSK